MFSNGRSIKLTWFIELKLNRYKLLLFLWLVHFNLFHRFIKNILQILRSNLPFLIFELCVSSLFDKRSLILKLVLRCYWRWSVVRILTGHTYFLPLLACGSLLQGSLFLIAPVNINTFIEYDTVPQVIQVWSCVGKCWIKGYQGEPSPIRFIPFIWFFLHIYVVCFILTLTKTPF